MTSWLLNGLKNLYSKNPIFESSDPDFTAEGTAQALKEHQLIWKNGKVDSVLRCIKLGELSFMMLRYGAAVHVSPDYLKDFYLFQVPTLGRSLIGVGDKVVQANPQTAGIISPMQPLSLDWDKGCEQFLIKIPKSLIDQAYMQLLDIAPDDLIIFDPSYSLNTPHGQALQHQISTILSYASQKNAYPDQWFANIQANLLQHLLLTQPNNYSRLFHHSPAMTGQRRLRVARHYIHQNLTRSIRLEEIAQACNSSIRSMTEAFRLHLNMSPTQYIREARLAAVRQELLKAPSNATVTDIATKWGFTHLGRFSAWYKQMYHESPLDTLKK